MKDIDGYIESGDEPDPLNGNVFDMPIDIQEAEYAAQVRSEGRRLAAVWLAKRDPKHPSVPVWSNLDVEAICQSAVASSNLDRITAL